MYIYDCKFRHTKDSLQSLSPLSRRLQGRVRKEASILHHQLQWSSHSHRCNPIAPELLEDMARTTPRELHHTIMLGLNRTWIQKPRGDFFVESLSLLTLIWFLKLCRRHLPSSRSRDIEPWLQNLPACADGVRGLSTAPFPCWWDRRVVPRPAPRSAWLPHTDSHYTYGFPSSLLRWWRATWALQRHQYPEDPKILVVRRQPQ